MATALMIHLCAGFLASITRENALTVMQHSPALSVTKAAADAAKRHAVQQLQPYSRIAGAGLRGTSA